MREKKRGNGGRGGERAKRDKEKERRKYKVNKWKKKETGCSSSHTHQRDRVQDGSVPVGLDNNLLLIFLPPVGILRAKHFPHQLQESVKRRENRTGGGWKGEQRGATLRQWWVKESCQTVVW